MARLFQQLSSLHGTPPYLNHFTLFKHIITAMEQQLIQPTHFDAVLVTTGLPEVLIAR